MLTPSPRSPEYDAVVVGSGPNGLAAAITLAREGCKVLLMEAAGQLGGGLRSVRCTLPGFVHDHCSTIHALGPVSPFLRSVPLEQHGLRWVHPGAPCAHPLDDGSAGVAELSLEETCEGLGADGKAYRRLYAPLLEQAQALLEHNLGPFRLPRQPLLMARFGLRALRPAVRLARSSFTSDAARGLFAGMAAHSVLPLERPLTSAIALMLSITAHDQGWPMAEGGSQRLADALVAIFREHHGEVAISSPVRRLADVPPCRAVLFDLAPRLVARIAGDELPSAYRQRLERYRHGPGVFKLDWALSGPIPWTAPGCARAGTVHLGGTLDEVAAAERAPWEGKVAARPFVLLSQPTMFDATRAPAGRHVGWAYCHVPPGCDVDMTEAIEAQVERFAPGFRDLILERHATSPARFEADNGNCVGGDIIGGVMDATQLYTRPVARWDPYTTPSPRLFLCSASTPPGAGVHGMCGWHAARSALRRVLRG